LLDRLLDFSTPETAGTDSNAFRRAFHQRAHGLKVRIEHPLGLVIGVTDVMAALVPFPAYIACKCHSVAPFFDSQCVSVLDATIRWRGVTSLCPDLNR
jgi:hypothetical protein